MLQFARPLEIGRCSARPKTPSAFREACFFKPSSTRSFSWHPASLPLRRPQASPPTGLSFGDGFQFGCGLFSAGLVAGVIVLLALLLIGLVLSLTGVNLLSSLLGQAPLP